MAGTKMAGANYTTKCPGCGDELVVGWLPGSKSGVVQDITILDAADLADPETTSKLWIGAADPDSEVAAGPLTCTCGGVTLTLDVVSRVVLTWTGDEVPVLANRHVP